MAITFQDLMAATKRLHVQFAGHKVGFEYRPAAWTAAQEGQWRLRQREMVKQVRDDPDSVGEELIEESEKLQDDFLVAHIVSWEITGEDKKPLPVTMDTLAKFPTAFRNALFNAIEDDRNPTPARKK